MSTYNIEEHLDTYFVPRNRITIKPIRDVNYTLETLTYMTAASPADKITNLLINLQKSIRQTPFVIYEPCAGIGGNTMSFLNRDEVSFVHSFERVPQRQNIITTNISAYSLSYKWDLRAEFIGVPETENGYVVYFDPPWLPEGISGLKFDKSQYILKDARVGKYTIEEWLTHLNGASLVVYRVPPNYNFRSITGWNILVNDELSNKKNARLVIALNKKYYNDDIKITKNYFYPTLSSVQSTKGKQFESAYNYNKIEHKETLQIPNLPQIENNKIPPLFGSVRKNISNPVVELEKVIAQTPAEYEAWVLKLVEFLSIRLANIVTNDELRIVLLSGKNTNVWITAFTHKSYDPINNYEISEFLGDAAAELMFKQFISEKFSGEIEEGIIGEAGITNLKNTYMSKIYQSQIGNELEFPKYVRTRTTINIHIAEDLVESFIGALMKTGNNVKPGLGYILVYNWIYDIFNTREIELTYIFGPAKTQIQQFFSNMGWGPAPNFRSTFTSKYGEGETITLSLTEAAKRGMAELKINAQDIIGVGTGNTDRSAEATAYDNAFKYFNSLGLTHDWLQSRKHLMEFNEIDHPEYTGLINKLFGKMMTLGLIRLEFKTHVISGALSDTNKTYLLELHGHRAGAEKTIVLVSGITNEIKNKYEADPSKVRLLENFLKMKI